MKPPHGVLVVDKPAGLSSAHVVASVKRALRAERVGHAGTLDPLATGVLPICLGAGTKLSTYLLAEDKTYEATALLGAETDTLDREGRVTREAEWSHVTREALATACAALVGETTQVPPMYSAIKHEGVELYKRARRGEDVERAPRTIRVDRLELIAFDPPHFRFVIACGKGTYVRTLIEDLGRAVGSAAHMTELRRTRCGRFDIANAVPLYAITQPGYDVTPALIPLTEVTDLPKIAIPPDLLKACVHAVQLPVELMLVPLPERFQLIDAGGRLVAVAHAEDGRLIFDRVFPELLPDVRPDLVS